MVDYFAFFFARCMIRRLKSEVLTQLPSKRRQMIILDPSLVSSKSKEMYLKATEIQKKSLSSEQRRAVLLQWFNLTSASKEKAVLNYVKDLLEGERKFLCFAHHQVRKNLLVTTVHVVGALFALLSSPTY